MVTISMFEHRSTEELCKQRERTAEGKEQTKRNTMSHLMAQVELSERGPARALEEHQMLMSEIM